MTSTTLLLTSAIVPDDSKNLTRSSIEQRSSDYARALTSWLASEFFSKIVLCDNSGFTSEKLKEILKIGNIDLPENLELEILSFKDQSSRPELHYGYNELGIIDYAIRNSQLIKKSNFFVKCTGRLYYPEIQLLIDCITPDCKFIVDARSDFLLIKNEQITTQLMTFNSRFYKSVLHGTRDEMTANDYYIEKYLYRALLPYIDDPDCIFRWPSECLPVGVGAQTGQDYRSARRLTFSKIRNFTRKYFPGIWI